MAYICDKCKKMWHWRPELGKEVFSFAECMFEPIQGTKTCPTCANPKEYSKYCINTCLKCNKQFQEEISLNSLYCPKCELEGKKELIK